MAADDLTAMVTLRAASGKQAGETPITARNIEEYLPSPEILETALQAFRNAGFQTGTRVGNTFSVTASQEAFERFFHARIDRKKSAGMQLPVPEGLRSAVEAVTFDVPREFD